MVENFNTNLTPDSGKILEYPAVTGSILARQQASGCCRFDREHVLTAESVLHKKSVVLCYRSYDRQSKPGGGIRRRILVEPREDPGWVQCRGMACVLDGYAREIDDHI